MAGLSCAAQRLLKCRALGLTTMGASCLERTKSHPGERSGSCWPATHGSNWRGPEDLVCREIGARRARTC